MTTRLQNPDFPSDWLNREWELFKRAKLLRPKRVVKKVKRKSNDKTTKGTN